jgi:hypothetical protein
LIFAFSRYGDRNIALFSTLIAPSMPKWLKYLFALLFFSPSLFSQSVIQGRVVSSETNSPLSSVSVYLNNTSIGTITNDKGIFILRNIPPDRFRLVVSSVGYETHTELINPKKLSGELLISLKPKAEQLGGVSLLPDDPNGWKKWGNLFTNLFIGTNSNSNQCHIENTEIIKLRLNPDNTLTAYAREPLEIVNYALGYKIKYRLEEFEFDFNTKVVTVNGYALFTDMALSGKKKSGKYVPERKEAYLGSLMHFMRAYWINKLEEQGFEMRNLGKISNPGKDKAKLRFHKEWLEHHDSTLLDTLIYEVKILPPTCGSCIPEIQKTLKTADSTDIYKKKLREPDSVISHQIVLADSIGFAEDSATAGMYFKDSLEITFKLKQPPAKYKTLSKDHKKETGLISQFVFVNKKPVYINANGYYYGPHDLKITGFWAWWETMSTMLPYDYAPD